HDDSNVSERNCQARVQSPDYRTRARSPLPERDRVFTEHESRLEEIYRARNGLQLIEHFGLRAVSAFLPKCATQNVLSPYSEVGIARLLAASHTGFRCLPKEGGNMPERETIEQAREDARKGKSPSTQAGEFVREEFEHIREGKHGARSPQQAIAIGLSKARRAGVNLKAPKGPASVRKKAQQDTQAGQHKKGKTSAKRSRATSRALNRESRSSGSRKAVSRQ